MNIFVTFLCNAHLTLTDTDMEYTFPSHEGSLSLLQSSSWNKEQIGGPKPARKSCM